MTVLGAGTIEELRQSVRGEVITPGDDTYESARAVWNGMIDKRPGLILRCAGVADVIAGVQFARSQGLELAVRGGGHSLPGSSTSEGGMVVDLSPMKGIRVDPEAGRVRAEAGVVWGELDHETQAWGLALTGGLVSSTGIAGFTLGGGIGWLMRAHGLACDNLVSVDVVTADGRLVHASESEHADLLWGLRGGGGNLGIVTSFEFRLHRVGPVILGGPVFYPADQATEVIRGWRQYTADAPDDMTTIVNLGTAPPLPFLPADVHGHRIATVIAAYASGPDAGREFAAPLRTLGDAIADLLAPLPYTALQSLVDPLFGPGARNYFTAVYLSSLPDEAIDALVAGHGSSPSASSEIHIHHMGGAVARVPDDATAYGNRAAPYLVNIVARWTDEATDDAHMGWARRLRAALEPFSSGGAYVNFVSAGDAPVRAGYSAATYARLAGVEGRVGPDEPVPPQSECGATPGARCLTRRLGLRTRGQPADMPNQRARWSSRSCWCSPIQATWPSGRSRMAGTSSAAAGSAMRSTRSDQPSTVRRSVRSRTRPRPRRSRS